MRVNSKSLRKKNPRAAGRKQRQVRVRKKVQGDAERPRICVFRSARHVYAQAIDDVARSTVAQASTMEKSFRDAETVLNKKDAAAKIGEAIAARLKEKGIASAVFDRNGFRFHGRVAAVAKGAREGGLLF